jgi:hypothetical protein
MMKNGTATKMTILNAVFTTSRITGSENGFVMESTPQTSVAVITISHTSSSPVSTAG